MRLVRFKVLVIASLFAIMSCGKSEPDNTPTGTEQPADPTLPQLTIDNPLGLQAYVGEQKKFTFTVSGKDAPKAKVSGVDAVNSKIVNVEYNSSLGTGSFTVELLPSSLEHQSSQITLEVSVASKSNKYHFPVTPYYILVNYKSPVFSGEKDEAINIGLLTNIPNLKPKVNTDSDWLSYSDGCLISLSENHTGEIKEALVYINDQENHFDDIIVKASQNTLGPAETPGCVTFKEWPLKRACVSIADANGDNEVSFEEAEAIQELDLHGIGIKDLTGLEAFKNVWKLDLQNNSIEDATILKELHKLYWLDVKGNTNLINVDISGCTLYFEHLEIDLKSKVMITACYNQQIAANYNTHDPKEWSFLDHITFIEDTRQSTDYTNDNKLVKVRSHTRGAGRMAIVFTGYGYLDVDFADNSADRLFNDVISEAVNRPALLYENNIDLFDIYYLCLVNETRSTVSDYHKEMDKTIGIAYDQVFGTRSNVFKNFCLIICQYNVNNLKTILCSFRSHFFSTAWGYSLNPGSYFIYNPSGYQIATVAGTDNSYLQYYNVNPHTLFKNDTCLRTAIGTARNTIESIRAHQEYQLYPEWYPIVPELELLRWNPEWDSSYAPADNKPIIKRKN